ncbi:MAG: helix-turn-helix transcriptional regulator [Bacilli bacterium]|nr:helix-turn-helix transcriptional regulator [Bacilli bacterium]
MNLGNNLFNARKKAGFSQEEVAEKLGISRQTISKWETNETIPNIYESKQLAQLYNLSLDELLDFDVYLKEIEEAIKNSNPAKEEKINWTNTWGKKYPILIEYHNKVDIKKYSYQIRELLNSLQKEYDYNNLDSMLVLKDILYHEWKDNK